MDIAAKLRAYKRDRYGYAEYCHQAADEIDRLRQVARSVYEVWAGSEGIPMPETAAEAYLLRLVEQMRDEAKNGLHNVERNRDARHHRAASRERSERGRP